MKIEVYHHKQLTRNNVSKSSVNSPENMSTVKQLAGEDVARYMTTSLISYDILQ